MSDSYNKPVEFDESAARAGQAAQEAASAMEEAVLQAHEDAHKAAEAAAAQSAQAAQAAGDTADAAGAKADEIAAEIGRVGSQVADQAKAAWESEQRKEFQDQVVKGLSSVAAAIEEQVKKLAANPDAQRFVGKVEETTNSIVEQARGSKTLQEAAEAIVKGLNTAATSIERWLSQQKAGSAPAAPQLPALSPDDPQDIRIERPAVTPATPAAPPAPDAPDKPTYV